MIPLGRRVKDTLTGFRGIAISRVTPLHGCPQVLVQPRGLADGKIVDPTWIDEPRLALIRKDEPDANAEPVGNSTPSGPYPDAVYLQTIDL